MHRLKPTTRKAIESLAGELEVIASDIEPARPFLAQIFRNLAYEFTFSLAPKDGPFRILIPDGVSFEVDTFERLKEQDRIVLYPPTSMQPCTTNDLFAACHGRIAIKSVSQQRL